MLRLAAVLVVLIAAPLVMAGPASAHAALVSSQPGAGYAVTSPPDMLVLQFSEPVSLPADALTLTGADGARLPLRASLDAGGTAVRGVPAGPVPAGTYQIGYRIVARDGDLITGSYAFGVATPVTAGSSGGSGGTGQDPDGVRPGTAWWRALLFLGVSLALGGAYLAWRVDEATGGLPGPRPWVRGGSVTAGVGAVGLLLALAPVTDVAAAVSTPGAARLLGAQAALLLTAAVLAHRPLWLGSIAPLLAVVALEGVRAHLGEASGPPGMLLTAAHLLVGALWLGGLIHLLRLARSWRDRKAAVQVAVVTYARNALVLFVLAAVTGTLSALLLLPDRAQWTGTAYGQVLLVKIALFAAVVLAALVGRRRLRRSGAGPRQPSSVAAIGRAARVEVGLLAVLVFVTAALTSATPARLVPASSVLTAPVGPVLRTADRVRQVSVSLVASQGRIEVRADAPDDGRPLTIELLARLTAAAGPTRPVPLTSCGRSCWTGPADWTEGTNSLAVDVDAGRWEAGELEIAVAWPPTPAPTLLAQVQQAMGARSAVDTVETVTSGFGNAPTTTSRRTGQDYLQSQPWSEGGATDAVVVGDADSRTLIFALPALGYHFAMQLDAQDRVVSERIVTPNHLIVRRYTFPAEPG